MDKRSVNITAVTALFFVSVLLISGCGDAKSKVLARVNGKSITVGDFDTRLSKMPAYYKAIASKRKKDFLDDMINEQLIYKESLKRGLDRDAEVRELIEEAKHKILVAKLLEVEGKKWGVTEEKIKEYYEAHKEEFATPLKMRASHIMVDSGEQAEEVLKKLSEGSDFAALAKEYSKDPSKEKGGDIGYFVKGQLIPEIEEVCLKLKVGETSGVIKTKIGYHIIKVTDRIEPKESDFSQVRSSIEKGLSDMAQREAMDNLIKNLRAKARIRINDKLLEEQVK